MPWYQRLWEEVCTFFFSNWNKILVFALVLIFGLLAIKIAVSILARIFRKSKLDNAAGDFIVSLIKAFLYIAYIIALLSLLGVPTTSLIAMLSAFALAISLALQNTISSLASGVVIILTKPFTEGDYVDIGDKSGNVEHISIFCTRLNTPDGKVIVIPNNTVAASEIINYNTLPTRRLEIKLSVAYGTSVNKVKTTVGGVLTRHKEILQDPAPMIRLAEHGASSLDFVCRVWVKNEDYWDTNFALKEEILEAFNKNNIEIPFNQLDVHVVNTAENKPETPVKKTLKKESPKKETGKKVISNKESSSKKETPNKTTG